MEAFLLPGVRFIALMRNELKFSMMAALFGLPLYLAAFAPRSPLQAQLTVASLVLLAYVACAFYAQAMKGWQGVLPQLRRLGEGDLGVDFDNRVDRAGQFAEAMQIAGEINAHFARIVRQASSGSQGIGLAAQEIAAGSQNLSERTQRQAATLADVAASMEELSATVRRNRPSRRLSCLDGDARIHRRIIGRLARAGRSARHSAPDRLRPRY